MGDRDAWVTLECPHCAARLEFPKADLRDRRTVCPACGVGFNFSPETMMLADQGALVPDVSPGKTMALARADEHHKDDAIAIGRPLRGRVGLIRLVFSALTVAAAIYAIANGRDPRFSILYATLFLGNVLTSWARYIVHFRPEGVEIEQRLLRTRKTLVPYEDIVGLVPGTLCLTLQRRQGKSIRVGLFADVGEDGFEWLEDQIRHRAQLAQKVA